MTMGGQDFTTCKPYLYLPSRLGWVCARALGCHARGVLSTRKVAWEPRVFEKQVHLMPGMTRRNHRHPRVPGNRLSSTGTHPIAAWHSNSTTRTLIITMATLTSDKLTTIMAGFSMKGPIHQVPGRSTPKQIICPGGFAPRRKSA
jgi:hypothetical protein